MEATICRYIASVEFEAAGPFFYIKTDQIELRIGRRKLVEIPYLAV